MPCGPLPVQRDAWRRQLPPRRPSLTGRGFLWTSSRQHRPRADRATGHYTPGLETAPLLCCWCAPERRHLDPPYVPVPEIARTHPGPGGGWSATAPPPKRVCAPPSGFPRGTGAPEEGGGVEGFSFRWAWGGATTPRWGPRRKIRCCATNPAGPHI